MDGHLCGAVAGHIGNGEGGKICCSQVLNDKSVNACFCAEFYLIAELFGLIVAYHRVHRTIYFNPVEMTVFYSFRKLLI